LGRAAPKWRGQRHSRRGQICFGDLLLVVLAASGGPTEAQLARAPHAIFATPASFGCFGCFGWIVFNTLELHLRRAAER
jgi:hypothetical protein